MVIDIVKKKIPRLEKKIEKEVETDVKKEEKVIFKEFKFLKRKHQAIFALIISTGVIFVWRGLWNLMDEYWLPDFVFWSNVSGIAIGMLILYFAHEIIQQLAGE